MQHLKVQVKCQPPAKMMQGANTNQTPVVQQKEIPNNTAKPSAPKLQMLQNKEPCLPSQKHQQTSGIQWVKQEKKQKPRQASSNSNSGSNASGIKPPVSSPNKSNQKRCHYMPQQKQSKPGRRQS